MSGMQSNLEKKILWSEFFWILHKTEIIKVSQETTLVDKNNGQFWKNRQ